MSLYVFVGEINLSRTFPFIPAGENASHKHFLMLNNNILYMAVTISFIATLFKSNYSIYLNNPKKYYGKSMFYGIPLLCTALDITALDFTALVCTGLHYNTLDCTELHCTSLHCTPLHCISDTALHCTALHCTACHGTVLYLYYDERRDTR